MIEVVIARLGYLVEAVTRERNRKITADVDPNGTITTKRGRVLDIRGITIGMIHEYARHNGHADIVRELIDGVTGE